MKNNYRINDFNKLFLKLQNDFRPTQTDITL
nr:MAG TPA: hypothetical protein [Caudoviricetes sp.]